MKPDDRTEGLERMDLWAWLAVAVTMVAMAVAEPRSLVAFGLPALFYWAARRAGKPLPKGTENRVGLICALGCLVDYLVFRDGVLGFAFFFCSLAAISMHTGRGRGSLRQLYLVLTLVMLVVSTRTLELAFLLFLILFTTATLICFLREAHPETVSAGFRRRYVGVCLAFVAASFVVAGPLFFVLPRAPFVLFNPANLPSVTGFGDEVSLGEMASIKKSSKLYMRVYAKDQKKWRGQVLDHYANRKWTSRGSRGLSRTLQAEPGRPARTIPGDRTPLTDYFLQEILIEPYTNRALFSAAQPAAIELIGYPVNHSVGDTLSRGGDTRFQKITYRVWSKLPQATQAQLEATTGPLNVAHSVKDYLQLPDGLLRLRKLGGELTRGRTSWYAKAAAIEDHLVTKYAYTLDLPEVGSGDPVEAFLFETKRGHCEYFASAMALLLRSQGIPSRVVTGFSFGEYNAFGGYYNVREKDAHAWVEAYLPGIGWWEFDPTASSNEPEALGFLDQLGLTQSAAWLQMKAWLDSLDAQWQREVVSYSADGQRELMARVAEFFDDLYIAAQARFYRGRTWVHDRKAPLVALLTAVLAVSLAGGRKRAAAAGLWLFELLAGLLASRAHRGIRAARVTAFTRAAQLLAAHGLERRPDWTPLEYTRTVERERPELAPALDALALLHCTVEFAGAPLEEADRRMAEERLKELAKLLRGRKVEGGR